MNHDVIALNASLSEYKKKWAQTVGERTKKGPTSV